MPSTIASERISLAEYLQMQKEEVYSDLNRLGACQEFGPNPTDNQLWQHYIHSRRAEEMAGIHSDLNILGSSEVIGCDVMSLSFELREAVLTATYQFWQIICANQAAKNN
ncbi:MAG: hypothetical protein WC508_01135 [Patescibacteria group bacterium]